MRCHLINSFQKAHYLFNWPIRQTIKKHQTVYYWPTVLLFVELHKCFGVICWWMSQRFRKYPYGCHVTYDIYIHLGGTCKGIVMLCYRIFYFRVRIYSDTKATLHALKRSKYICLQFNHISGIHSISLRSSDATWRQIGSTLTQVMACYLIAQSHYLNTSGVMWHSPKVIFERKAEYIYIYIHIYIIRNYSGISQGQMR